MKWRVLGLAVIASLGVACSDDTTAGSNNTVNSANNGANNVSNNGSNSGTNGLDAGATNNGSTLPDADVPDTDIPDLPFAINDAGQVLCGDVPCECADGIDNDGDGTVDGFDVECTGPFDNDEDSFATGIPGDNRDPVWQDCFFDGNSGAGDDGCRYRSGCLTGDLPQDHPDCTLSQECIDFCAAYTPNGCDCFGCCEVYPEGSSDPMFVQIGTTCSDDKFNDPVACPVCVPTTQCGNPCGECELCGGKTVEDLPASCFTSTPGGDAGTGMDAGTTTDGGTTTTPDGGGGEPVYTCDNGEQVCSPTEPCATAGEYCSQGCCIKIFN